jgi:2-polyprenyl-6-methoxyphenol hydroxylase-like FAD-dependent oxidoreductase
MALLNWGDLYAQLRRRVPEECYRPGVTATDVGAAEGGRVRLSLENGREHETDLALFADGYRSLGRRLLFPDSQLNYRGYVLWRGVLEERELGDPAPLETSLHRLHYNGLAGNAVFYLVPGRGGSVARGSRWVNWAAYLPVPPGDLPGFLVDREGRHQEMSIPPGLMRPEEEQRLKELLTRHLPPYFADIVGRSRNTFAQPIYTAEVPGYARDRCALLGDAGSVAPPFTGSGVFKAVSNAVDLVDALGHGRLLDQNLAAWSEVQAGTGRRLAALGEQMEQAFVWAAPDLAQMDEDAAREWWTRAVTFPDDFSYVHETEPSEPD